MVFRPTFLEPFNGPFHVVSAAGEEPWEVIYGTETANLLALWRLNETSGATADNAEGTAARDGTYTGVTLNNSTGPDGEPVPLFDSTNDFVNVYSDSLRDAFNGAEGTAMVFAKVYNVGVWTNGSRNVALCLRTDSTSLIYLWVPTANNTISIRYYASATDDDITEAGHSETGWLHFAATWHASNDEFKAYLDGALIDTATTIGAWQGLLTATQTVIGGQSTAPNWLWYGWLSNAAIWSKALTGPQIATINSAFTEGRS